MSNIHIELTQDILKKLVLRHLQDILGPQVSFKPEDVIIQVKSQQNYKSEWETADFRAVVHKSL